MDASASLRVVACGATLWNNLADSPGTSYLGENRDENQLLILAGRSEQICHTQDPRNHGMRHLQSVTNPFVYIQSGSASPLSEYET